MWNMDVLKWCKNNSKWLYFSVLLHISILIIHLPTAEMVKNQLSPPLKPFYCECHFPSSESSILNLFFHPPDLYSWNLCSWKTACEIVMKLTTKQFVCCLFPVFPIYMCIYMCVCIYIFSEKLGRCNIGPTRDPSSFRTAGASVGWQDISNDNMS